MHVKNLVQLLIEAAVVRTVPSLLIWIVLTSPPLFNYLYSIKNCGSLFILISDRNKSDRCIGSFSIASSLLSDVCSTVLRSLVQL